MSNYWKDVVPEILDDAGIVYTPEQLAQVIEGVEGCHENYGMAHGHDALPNPDRLEIDKLKKALRTEQDKVVCKQCWGRGSITENFGVRSSTSQCDRCNGEGKVKR